MPTFQILLTTLQAEKCSQENSGLLSFKETNEYDTLTDFAYAVHFLQKSMWDCCYAVDTPVHVGLSQRPSGALKHAT